MKKNRTSNTDDNSNWRNYFSSDEYAHFLPWRKQLQDFYGKKKM